MADSRPRALGAPSGGGPAAARGDRLVAPRGRAPAAARGDRLVAPRGRALAVLGGTVGALARTASGPAFRALTAPPLAKAGHRFATEAARLWGRLLGGEERQVGALTVISGLPSWAYGRGGTTIGATFLTTAATSPEILEHEDVHRQQWARYGLWFIAMYLAAGQDGLQNKYEVEADLVKGGYLPKRPANPPAP